MIDVALVTWPNHPARFEYFKKCLAALHEKLNATRHQLRFFCSAESERDPTRPWLGDELEDLCRELEIALAWRNEKANLGGNMNSALSLCSAPTILLQQDDWMLGYPLDLSPGADFLVANRDVDILRYSWPDNDRMRPTFAASPDGWRRIDMRGKWPYGDDPHLRRPDFMEKWGWYYDLGGHGTASATLMRKLRMGNADIRVADRCYYAHGGPVTSVINDVRERRAKR